MLVLSRRLHETIRYVVAPSTEPTVIELTVIRSIGGPVRLGSVAPDNVRIVRAELLDKPATKLGEGND